MRSVDPRSVLCVGGRQAKKQLFFLSFFFFLSSFSVSQADGSDVNAKPEKRSLLSRLEASGSFLLKRNSSLASSEGSSSSGASPALPKRSPRDTVTAQSQQPTGVSPRLARVSPRADADSVQGSPSPRRGSRASPRKSTPQSQKVVDGEPATVRKAGYLKKKGKKRWFLLVNGWLFWFVKDVDIRSNNTDWGFIEKAKGSLFIPRCNVAQGEKLLDFVVVNPADKNYVMSCKDEEERDEWVLELSRVTATAQTSSGEATEKKGWLSIKGKQHWCVLKEGVLMWFIDDQSADVQGSTTLASATVALGATPTGEPAFVIATLDNFSKYVFSSSDRADTEEWASCIRVAIGVAKERDIVRLEAERAEREAARAAVFQNTHVPLFTGKLIGTGNEEFFHVLDGPVIMWFKG
jgi:hypothetical protein